ADRRAPACTRAKARPTRRPGARVRSARRPPPTPRSPPRGAVACRRRARRSASPRAGGRGRCRRAAGRGSSPAPRRRARALRTEMAGAAASRWPDDLLHALDEPLEIERLREIVHGAALEAALDVCLRRAPRDEHHRDRLELGVLL